MVAVIENNTLKVTEGSTPIYSVTLVDENELPVPSNQIDSIQLTYKDDMTGLEINDRTNQDVFNANDCTYGVTNGLFKWTFVAADTANIDPTKRFETFSAVLTWIWNTSTKQQRHEFYIQVENLGRTCWQNFINRVALRVGAGRRIIELTDDHWCEAVQQAMDLLSNYLFRTEWAHLPAVAAANTVIDFGDIQSETYDPNLLRVVNVQFVVPQDDSPTSQQSVFTLSERLVYGGRYTRYGGGRGYGLMAPTGRVGLGDILFQKHYNEAQLRVTGSEPDWLWDETNRTLAISTPTHGPYDITYIKAYPYTPGTLPQNYMRYFLEAVEGYARLMIADIRGKFGQQLPGPTGGTETDAGIQLQRGQDMIQKVEEALRKLPLQANVEFG